MSFRVCARERTFKVFSFSTQREVDVSCSRLIFQEFLITISCSFECLLCSSRLRKRLLRLMVFGCGIARFAVMRLGVGRSVCRVWRVWWNNSSRKYLTYSSIFTTDDEEVGAAHREHQIYRVAERTTTRPKPLSFLTFSTWVKHTTHRSSSSGWSVSKLSVKQSGWEWWKMFLVSTSARSRHITIMKKKYTKTLATYV